MLSMYCLERCLACDGVELVVHPAVLAPFVRERIGVAERTTTLVGCRGCGLTFFRERYGVDESARLYADYRGEAYFVARHRHEPWYTRSLNARLGTVPAEIQRRRARLAAFLEEAGAGVVESVLDYGGDRGQFIPRGIPQRQVYDVSGVAPDPDVVGVDANTLRNLHPDLVLLAGVLEHVADPAALLRELLSMDHRLLYIEVPLEPFRPSRLHRWAGYRRYVEGLAQSRALGAVVFASTVSRLMLGWIPPGGVVQQHEHLTFFTERALRHLVARLGYEIVRSRTWPEPWWQPALGLLARAPARPRRGPDQEAP